ncbi:iron(III) transport system substrate-binding protein [Halogranum rubrum]|uniref:Iron(III) transport system substrate-binding protein n=1 Tax=Halogranum rubrum TaxID=553466 RepID=A0A1I4CQU7_9EURY|nr:extracellular solute-binding protein [Halogranum rubrum]SFK83638.1 iron(III) transport system substrate-binding protein [Halogranum rubrum]
MTDGHDSARDERTPRRSRRRLDRRRFLAGLGTATTVGVAGCMNGNEGTTTESGGNETGGDFGEFRGSGALAEGRGELEGTRMADLPSLSGELTVYIGGGEGGLYLDLLSRLEARYDDFSVNHREYGTAEGANTLINESEATPADVFWSVDAGSLSAVANEGLTTTLSSEVVEPVPDAYHPEDSWVGTAGRARAVPYNTDELSADEVADKVDAFPGIDAFQDSFGWAPTYGAFQAFVTAMRLIRGRQETRDWLQRMLDAGASSYNNEFLVANAVADGEITAGFANHYYALRVKASRPDAPLDLAFTSGDAGALVNTAGTAVLQASDQQELAETFIRHLLSAEAQEFFATRLYAYPMIPEIPPVGGLPTIEELDPPELDLSKLSNIQPTLDLLREVGVL